MFESHFSEALDPQAIKQWNCSERICLVITLSKKHPRAKIIEE
jgi:hypothetical protein